MAKLKPGLVVNEEGQVIAAISHQPSAVSVDTELTADSRELTAPKPWCPKCGGALGLGRAICRVCEIRYAPVEAPSETERAAAAESLLAEGFSDDGVRFILARALETGRDNPHVPFSALVALARDDWGQEEEEGEEAEERASATLVPLAEQLTDQELDAFHRAAREHVWPEQPVVAGLFNNVPLCLFGPAPDPDADLPQAASVVRAAQAQVRAGKENLVSVTTALRPEHKERLGTAAAAAGMKLGAYLRHILEDYAGDGS